MATTTRATRSEPAGTVLLEQLAELDAGSLSAATAQKILDLRFSAAQQKRVKALSEKARKGTLTSADEKDLDDFIHVGNLLAILQSKARQVLNRSDAPS